MVKIESIPTEIWQSIITASCTDGGPTGRSLALSCKFLHVQSLSSRFHSLAFDSLQFLEDFVACLRAQHSSCRPTIAHLFLSFLDEPVKTPHEFWRIYSQMSTQQKAAHDKKAKDDKAQWEDRFLSATSALLSVATPSLLTLCVLSHPTVRLPPFINASLPKLEELTWMGSYNGIGPLASTGIEASLFERTPVLQRLHYIPGWAPELSSLITSLSRDAPPPLTHLRISGLEHNHARLPAILSRSLGLDLPFHDDKSPVETKLSRISNLILHGTPPPPDGECGHNHSTWEYMMNELEGQEEEYRLRGIRLLVIRRPWRANWHWEDRVYQDWLDRIEGGIGCWVGSGDEEVWCEQSVDGLQEPLVTAG